MRGLKKDNMKREHHTDIQTLRLYERIGLRADSLKRDFFHCRQTQSVPREYHTQCYVVEVQTLVELNPNILVRRFQRMLSQLLNDNDVCKAAPGFARVCLLLYR